MPFLIGAGAAVVLLVLAGIAWWVARTYVAITVEGSSMTPTLTPGDRVLIRRGRRSLQRDQIVVIREPGMKGWAGRPPASRSLTGNGWYIKRLVGLPGDPMDPRVVGHGDVVPEGHIIVIGDHPHSGDSKQHGPCPIDQILGVVVRQMERKDVEEVAPDGWQKLQLGEGQWVTLPEGGRVLLPAKQWVYVANWQRVKFSPPEGFLSDDEAGDHERFSMDGLPDWRGVPPEGQRFPQDVVAFTRDGVPMYPADGPPNGMGLEEGEREAGSGKE